MIIICDWNFFQQYNALELEDWNRIGSAVMAMLNNMNNLPELNVLMLVSTIKIISIRLMTMKTRWFMNNLAAALDGPSIIDLHHRTLSAQHDDDGDDDDDDDDNDDYDDDYYGDDDDDTADDIMVMVLPSLTSITKHFLPSIGISL